MSKKQTNKKIKIIVSKNNCEDIVYNKNFQFNKMFADNFNYRVDTAIMSFNEYITRIYKEKTNE